MRVQPSEVEKNTCSSKLYHQSHLVGQSTFPLPVVIVQPKHSKEDNQHHCHEHDHPSVGIGTCTKRVKCLSSCAVFTVTHASQTKNGFSLEYLSYLYHII